MKKKIFLKISQMKLNLESWTNLHQRVNQRAAQILPLAQI